MSTRFYLIIFTLFSLVTPKNNPIEKINEKYKIILNNLSKAIFAGYCIKLAYKLATSKIEIFGQEIYKKSNSLKIKILSEVLITGFEIFRREWDGTSDCCDSETIFNSTIYIKIIGKFIGMRIPIPFLKD